MFAVQRRNSDQTSLVRNLPLCINNLLGQCMNLLMLVVIFLKTPLRTKVSRRQTELQAFRTRETRRELVGAAGGCARHGQSMKGNSQLWAAKEREVARTARPFRY